MKNHVAVLVAAGTLGATLLMSGCGQKAEDEAPKNLPPLNSPGGAGAGTDISKVAPAKNPAPVPK